ncbi:MAG: transporter substrate-binding domain-containing protein [Thermodesulfobacteriota bacterium]|nr:transporter substrate-binding domain-containing protein [Thermodesulfobacteriota bacterium]
MILKHANFIILTTVFLSFLFARLAGAATETPQSTYRAGGDDSYPPYEFVDKNGYATGFNVELMRAIAEAAGFDITINLGPWKVVRSQITNGEIDMITGMYYSQARDKMFDFSIPHTIVSHGIFVRKDSPVQSVTDLAGKAVIVQEGDIMHDFVVEENITDKVIAVENQEKALRLLSNGMHNAALLAKLQGLSHLQSMGLDNIMVVGPSILPRKYCIAVKEGNTRLLEKINTGLTRVQASGVYNQIYNDWFGGYTAHWTHTRFLKIGLWTAGGFVAIVLIVVLWNRSLKRQVRERTRQLETELAERRRTETALKESREQLALALKAGKSGVWDFNPSQEGEYLSTYNERWLAMLGYLPGELPLCFETWEGLLHPGDHDRAMAALNDHLENGIPYSVEFRLKCKDGNYTWIHSMGRIVSWDKEGRPDRMIGIHVDISDRKAAEEERLTMERRFYHTQKLESLGVLAGGIAHDFNNLLMGILGNADLAMMDISPASPAMEYLQNIQEAAKRSADLTRQMLAYSGRGRFVVEPVDMNALIKEMHQLLSVSISKKAVLQFNLSSDLPVVAADATQMRQVIMNLVINASEALAEDRGTIRIATGTMECDADYLQTTLMAQPPQPGRYVYLEVSDTGCGMDRLAMDRIFDPFFTTKFKGRGLGLSALLGIAHGHKGTVKVESAPGEGTTFLILLPALASAIEADTTEKATSAPWKGHGAILLVDDEAVVRKTAGNMLKKMGFRVITAEGGQTALDLYQRQADEIVCIILDVTMPDMSGAETLEALRQLDKTVPVIMSSGYSEKEITETFSVRSIAGAIQKPYKFEDLKQKLRTVLA